MTTGPFPSRKPNEPYSAAIGQQWASNHVEASHVEALYGFGELCLFTMMWRPVDREQGLVPLCSRCFGGTKARQAAVFQQAIDRECPVCYGTTYEGGFRAQIVRPALWADRNAETTEQNRGVVTTDTLQVETTGDFTLRRGDYVFRFDNTRWQVDEKREAVVRTGFIPPLSSDSFVGPFTAHLEEQTTAAHKMPPTGEELLDLLGVPGPFTVTDLAPLDMVRPGGYV